MRLVDQQPCGILDSLIARLLLENQLEGVKVLVNALHYLSGAETISC